MVNTERRLQGLSSKPHSVVRSYRHGDSLRLFVQQNRIILSDLRPLPSFCDISDAMQLGEINFHSLMLQALSSNFVVSPDLDLLFSPNRFSQGSPVLDAKYDIMM